MSLSHIIRYHVRRTSNTKGQISNSNKGYRGVASTCLFALNLGLERHEVVVGLPQVVHVARHAVVGRQLHLELGHHRGDLLQPGQRDLDGLEALHVVVRVGPDAVPLVEHLK